jgi:hypothetical protein
MIELDERWGDGGGPSTGEDVTILPNIGLLVCQGQEIWAIDLTYFRNSTKVSAFLSSTVKTTRWVSAGTRKAEEDPTPIRKAQLIGSVGYDSGATDSSTTPRLSCRSFLRISRFGPDRDEIRSRQAS